MWITVRYTFEMKHLEWQIDFWRGAEEVKKGFERDGMKRLATKIRAAGQIALSMG